MTDGLRAYERLVERAEQGDAEAQRMLDQNEEAVARQVSVRINLRNRQDRTRIVQLFSEWLETQPEVEGVTIAPSGF